MNIGMNVDFLLKQKITARFIFELEGMFVGGFSKVKNIQRKIAREPYEEGGLNTQPIILASPQKELSQLVLEKGYVKMNPMVKSINNEIRTQEHIFRLGSLLVVNEYYIPIRTFYFEKGIISEWSMSDLDATSPNILVDSITIQHTGLIEETIL